MIEQDFERVLRGKGESERRYHEEWLHRPAVERVAIMIERFAKGSPGVLPPEYDEYQEA